MANTYTKIYLHIVFAVKNRNSIIPATYLKRIYSYAGGILKQHGHEPLAIGGIESHIHVLIRYNVNQPIPDMVRDLKTALSRYINEYRLIPYRFEWQKGYGCFSYSHSHIEAVKHYIENQFEHHKSTCLEDEIRKILIKFDIEFDERYILKNPEENFVGGASLDACGSQATARASLEVRSCDNKHDHSRWSAA